MGTNTFGDNGPCANGCCPCGGCCPYQRVMPYQPYPGYPYPAWGPVVYPEPLWPTTWTVTSTGGVQCGPS